MAKKFPHCDILGLDLAPAMFKLDEIPSNCRFEIDDINRGLSHYHGHFDFIHSRCIGSGVGIFPPLALSYTPHAVLSFRCCSNLTSLLSDCGLSQDDA
jgi:hypothetical protein